MASLPVRWDDIKRETLERVQKELNLINLTQTNEAKIYKSNDKLAKSGLMKQTLEKTNIVKIND